MADRRAGRQPVYERFAVGLAGPGIHWSDWHASTADWRPRSGAVSARHRARRIPLRPVPAASLVQRSRDSRLRHWSMDVAPCADVVARELANAGARVLVSRWRANGIHVDRHRWTVSVRALLQDSRVDAACDHAATDGEPRLLSG